MRIEGFDPQIEKLQKSLNQLLGTSLRADGVLGPETQGAVERFQKLNGLFEDGVPGPSTRQALDKVLSAGANQIEESKQKEESANAGTESAAEAWDSAKGSPESAERGDEVVPLRRSTSVDRKLDATGTPEKSGRKSTGSGTRQIWLVTVTLEQVNWTDAAESPMRLPVQGKTAVRVLSAISPGDFLLLYAAGKAQQIVGLGSVTSTDVAGVQLRLKLDMVFDDPIGKGALQDALPELLHRRGMLKLVEPDEWATLREIVRYYVPNSDGLMPKADAPERASCDLVLWERPSGPVNPGAFYGLVLKVTNTGNRSWKKGDVILVESPGVSIEDKLSDVVPPGGAGRTELSLQAPSRPGPAKLQITARVKRFGTDFTPGTLSTEIEILSPQESSGSRAATRGELLSVDETEEVVGKSGQEDKRQAGVTRKAEEGPASPESAATQATEDLEPSVAEETLGDTQKPETAGGLGEALDAATAAEVLRPVAATSAPFSVQDRRSLVLQFQQAFQPPTPRLVLRINRGSTTLTFAGQDYESPTAIDFEQLGEQLFASPDRYGGRLFTSVIRTEKSPGSGFLDTRHGYQEAVKQAAREVRFELRLDAADGRLRSLPWEYLIDPDSGDPPIAVNQRTPFYRLVGAQARLDKPQLPIKVLVVIASPDGLGQPGNRYLKDLEPLDVARERQIIVDALSPLATAGVLNYTILDQASGEGSAVLENIADALEEDYHVLHLMAHGFFIDTGEYCVALPGKQKAYDLVTVARFRDAMAGHQLRMALLQTCQSFSIASATSGQALGLELVEAGIPAVISMQGLLPIETAQFFTQHFYHDLARSGRVDMAMATTRRALYLASRRVGSARDWGLPVLQMATSEGQLFDVQPEDGVRLGDPEPHIKSLSELPSNAVATQTAGLADGIVREVDDVLRAAGSDRGVSAALGDRIRSRVAAALPDATTPTADPPQDRAALRWTLSNRIQLRGGELRQWVERRTQMRLLPSVYRQVVSALNAGKHVVLIGPPGTGKTTLAHAICDYARSVGVSAGTVPTTASADWTSFDTVGGYALNANQALEFRPGIFLRAISAGQWLVIDEINRAEIDKAVGELFTLLSGQQVDLPYRIAGQRIRILPPKTLNPDDWVPDDVAQNDYVVHPNWRILATMNVYDKSSLFSMSFAFMRRFAFVDVGVPHHDNLFHRLRNKWIANRFRTTTDRSARKRLRDKLNEIFSQGSALMKRRELGPAIASDMLRYLQDRVFQVHEEQGDAQPVGELALVEFLGEAFLLYAVPQLDGLDREAVLDVYGQIAKMFAKIESGEDILQRVRDLYPHIRDEEWKAAQQAPQD